jgi:hypothetical protein
VKGPLVELVTQSGCCTSKSAYSTFFEGSVKFRPCRLIWRSWAPFCCKFFLWLAVAALANRCWTADRLQVLSAASWLLNPVAALANRCWTADPLAKRGLPHRDSCSLCDQAGETIQHILIGCVFSRKIWALTLQSLHLEAITPNGTELGFFSWWARSGKMVPKNIRKGLNTLCIPIA